jgi:hypothetical protein
LKENAHFFWFATQAGTPPSAEVVAVRKWNPPGLAESPAYFHAAEVPAGAQLLFSSGLVGRRADGSLPAGTADQVLPCDAMSTQTPHRQIAWVHLTDMHTY